MKTAKLGSPPDDTKALIPLKRSYKTEITKANFKVKNFDPNSGKTLGDFTVTKKSIPVMLELNDALASEFKRFKGVKGLNKSALNSLQKSSDQLNVILKGQMNNQTDKAAIQSALGEMTSIKNKMENVIQ